MLADVGDGLDEVGVLHGRHGDQQVAGEVGRVGHGEEYRFNCAGSSSDPKREIQLAGLWVTQAETILAVERLCGGIFGLNNDRVDAE